MSVFDEVKSQISVRDAAEYYGFKVNRAGLIVCPFHDDKHPSCKVDHRFHCFACGADGDVIDFVSRLYGLSLWDSAKRLAEDFGIRVERGRERTGTVSSVRRKLSDFQQHKLDEKHCLHDLVQYRNRLWEWEKVYAPRSPTDEVHPLFVEALQRKDYTDYLIDLLLDGEESDKKELIQAWKRGEIRGVNDSGRSEKPAGIYREKQYPSDAQQLC